MQRFGIQVEDWFLNLAIAKGYKPKLTRWGTENCDMIIMGLPIEVKAARPTVRYRKGKQYTRWQWNIHSSSQQMQGEWVLVLVAQDASGSRFTYIIPGSVIGGREHLQLTSHPDLYRGWIGQWRNRWDVIDYLSSEVYRDGGPLFEQWEVAA